MDERLILKVEKKLWLTVIDIIDKWKIFGWTTTKPSTDIGHIDKDSILVFIRLSPYRIGEKQPLEFMVIHIGPVPGEYPVEFFEDEIDTLTKKGLLTLLDVEDIDEMSITMGKSFIKYPKDTSFGSPVLLPKDLYITMGPDEMKLSGGKITIGEKMSLKRLLEIYSTAIGQNLILK